ncbi:thiolase family protein [Marinactinospora thermotolerans]|uniref:Acetyl-CoA C-acetyltransferase n=1 Tax=Marinactinospora thermotolerans DSM 45154 TaxID=1122192 RepID=A0A1T4STC9_9ACTN|nr:thiolase family protein [Marinactinospora thermotolerans]SKA31443.1 acetyl-CoA C-acetyltransferase [Marinactinospora thermotolerans DSM 45154]
MIESNGSRDPATTPVIVAARRTAIGRAGGCFRDVGAEFLLAGVIAAVLRDGGVAADQVDEVVAGNAAGPGGNVARVAALTAGLPFSVPAVTVDRQCGAGLEAINQACRLVQAGAAEVVLAGGVESVSTAPWRVRRPSGRTGMPVFYDKARFSPDSVGDPGMGEAAENVARVYGVSRERQDAFAARSHRLAVQAQEEGLFADEITTLGEFGPRVERDECPRPRSSPERLARLRPAFVEGGTVTAGNSCPLNDGAAMVLVTSMERARALGHRRVLAFVDGAAAGVDPNLLGVGAVASTRRLLARQPGVELDRVDVVEFNEAFASQTLACLDLLGIDPDRVNRNGGAIALGHPYGASGAVLVTRVYSQLVRQRSAGEGGTAVAMMATAGGLGVSTLFTVVDDAS